MRYAFIRETLADRELYGMPLSERCRILGVSTSGYYEWLHRRNGRPRKKLHVPKRVMLSDETVLASVRRLRGLLGYTPGYRQFHELLRKRGIRVGVNRLQRLLRTNGFIGYRHSKRPYNTTDSNHDMTVYANLLNRDFRPGTLNRAWVSDITYLPTPNGTSYLATFMDLGSRRILGGGDRYEDDNGVHLEGPGQGCADTQAGETFCGRHDCALGSRFAVLLPEVSGPLGSAEHAPVDEPVGELLGQRARRVDLELAKARGAHWLEKVCRPRSSGHRRGSLDPCL